MRSKSPTMAASRFRYSPARKKNYPSKWQIPVSVSLRSSYPIFSRLSGAAAIMPSVNGRARGWGSRSPKKSSHAWAGRFLRSQSPASVRPSPLSCRRNPADHHCPDDRARQSNRKPGISYTSCTDQGGPMNLRCSYCKTPFAIGRNETLIALQMMQTEDLLHYDAHCPRCRRANQIPRDRLELSFPGWQEALAAITASPVPRAAAPKSKPAATAVSAKPAAKPGKKQVAVKKLAPAAAKAKPAKAKALPAKPVPATKPKLPPAKAKPANQPRAKRQPAK